ncbi:hypothetical protein LP092_07265 [Moraxella bovis]|uniref:Chromosome partitioning protein ParB n=1 Tax=Moraxella bovis TaxID=476 RepID=A0ABY6MDN7_MORBO|nr:hypothetical protein [Moraxella bovis]UZA04514.1 hypothetical protein LP092_07265 [Moraxella bovis]
MNSKEYYDWLQKFEKRNTSDDTFTPPAVYDVVLEYVNEHILHLDDLTIERPFYPDGDYQAAAKNYDENTVVIDNPPFSILSKIIDFYIKNNVKFFLFAPALTVFNSMRNCDCTAIIAPSKITYDNGAVVNTCFVTNLCGDVRAMTAPKLYNALQALEQQKPTLSKYQYSPNVLMVNNLNKLCKAGIEFSVSANESVFIRKLDSQKEHKKELFGGGLLISDNKAKELQAKELQTKELQAKNNLINWELSDRERAIVGSLGVNND